MKFLASTLFLGFVVIGSPSLALWSLEALQLDNESELREAQAALFNVNSESGWLLLNYVDPHTLHFSAGGEGGLDEFEQHLEDDQIQYLLVRANKQDTFVNWIGPRVGIIEQGKKVSYYGDAASYLNPYHREIKVGSKSQLQREFS